MPEIDHLNRKKKKKKRGNNKIVFGSCFRSFPDRGFKNETGFIKVSGCKRNNNTEFVPDHVNLVNGDEDCCNKRNKPNHRRSFSRVLKAVFLDSLVTKRIHRSSSKSSNASDTNTSYSSLSSEKISKSSDTCTSDCIMEYADMDDSCSRRSSSNLLSSSSRTTCSSYCISCSSSNSISRSSSNQKPSPEIDLVDFRCQDSSVSLPIAKPKSMNTITRSSSYQKGLPQLDSLDLRNSVLSSEKTKSSSNNWNISRTKCAKSVAGEVKLVDTESEQYKKRVIMAGLLDRTRNPIR
nr:dentin sialophosphoprotein-like [Tanacetum cinerariifolium]GEX60665.1 dentin sialophosphoprotein-like [Tanacetum cinerariifolium]